MMAERCPLSQGLRCGAFFDDHCVAGDKRCRVNAQRVEHESTSGQDILIGTVFGNDGAQSARRKWLYVLHPGVQNANRAARTQIWNCRQ